MSMSDDDLKQFNEQLAEGARLQADSNRMQALQLEVLTKLAQAQGINVDTITKSKNAFDGLKSSTNKQSAAAEANAYATEQMRLAQENFNKSLTSTTASAVSFGKALLSNEQGFAKYNDTLKNAGDAAMSLGKNFGILGFALGGAIKGLTMAAEQFTKQADNTLKATDSLSKLGGAGSLTADQVLSMGHKAGLTSSNLDIMTKAAAKANTGMAGLGGTVGDGIKAFGDMTAVTKEQRMAFQRMGVSQEELMSQQADYVKLQELSGINLADQAKQGKNLKAASLDYAENLVRLSTLTGKTADDLAKEKMLANEVYEEQIQTQMEQAKIRQLREDGYKDQADDLQRQQDNRKRAAEEYVHSFGKEQGLQMARAARTGTFDQSTAGLATMGFDPAAQKRKIEEAKSKEEVDAISAANRDDMKKKREQMLLSAGSAVVYGGESVGKALGLGGTETAQAYGRMGSRSETAAAAQAASVTTGLATGEAGAGGAAATDPAQVARNNLTEAEIAAKVELDKLIASFNPLLKGFDAGTIAALALATAAAAAALALGKMAASAVMNKMGGGGLDVPDRKGKGGKGGNHGGFGTGTKGAAREYEAKAGNKAYKSTIGTQEEKFAAQKAAEKSARKEFFENERASGGTSSGAGKVASAAGRLAGPAAGVVSVGMGAMTAYQGAKDVDEKVKKGELTKDEGTVKKSEAVGTGVGQAAGGAAGAWGGAAAGAAMGSIVPVVGTVIGGLLGAAVGGWLGSKGGEIVGENVGKSVGKSMVEKPKTDDSGRATAATDPRLAGATQTAATDPKVGNAIMKEEQESLSKGLANMVKEDQERAKQAKEDALKLTTTGNAQEVSITTLNKTLLATNTALTNLTASITNLSKPTASGGAGSMASLASKAAGGGISVPGGVPASFKSSGGGGAGAAGGLGLTSGDMPTKSNKPTSQPPEESGPGGGPGSATKTVDLTKIMKFGTNSGTQQNFEALDSSFKDAVTAAAKDYNATTGNKLQINSAKRDPADQQRIWDESVAAGREGKTASGMPIGKPGRSLHEKGQAIDIQNYKDPDAIAAMNKQGLTQKVPNDPVHFQAELGGILDGPTSGYPVEGTMHGREAIIPLNPESIITKLLTTSEAQIKQEMNTNNSITTTTADDTSSQIMSEMYAMMEEKFDAMIEALENGNDHTEKLVKFSAV